MKGAATAKSGGRSVLMKIDTDEIKGPAEWAAAGAVSALLVALFVPPLDILIAAAVLAASVLAFRKYRQVRKNRNAKADEVIDVEPIKEKENGND